MCISQVISKYTSRSSRHREETHKRAIRLGISEGVWVSGKTDGRPIGTEAAGVMGRGASPASHTPACRGRSLFPSLWHVYKTDHKLVNKTNLSTFKRSRSGKCMLSGNSEITLVINSKIITKKGAWKSSNMLLNDPWAKEHIAGEIRHYCTLSRREIRCNAAEQVQKRY